MLSCPCSINCHFGFKSCVKLQNPSKSLCKSYANPMLNSVAICIPSFRYLSFIRFSHNSHSVTCLRVVSKMYMLMVYLRFSNNVSSVTSLLLVLETCFLLMSISFSHNINVLTYCSGNVVLAHLRKVLHKFPSQCPHVLFDKFVVCLCT